MGAERREGRDRSARGQPGRGRPLEPAHRAHYEALLGVELADVRVDHDPARAAAHGAAAFADGANIVIGDSGGEERLAHELVHVAQWREHGRADATVGGRRRAEANARDLGADVAAGRRPRASLSPPGAALQREQLPASLDEVALEAVITSTLSRRVGAGDDEAALARVGDLTALFSRLDAHDAGLLHDRLRTADDPLGVLFRSRLATATRTRLLGQLDRQAAEGAGAPAMAEDERAYFSGLSLAVPEAPVLVDATAHPEEMVTLALDAASPQPAAPALTASWTVEAVTADGNVSEVFAFEFPWLPGMNIFPNYPVDATQVGEHFVTVRFRNDAVHHRRLRPRRLSDPDDVDERGAHAGRRQLVGRRPPHAAAWPGRADAATGLDRAASGRERTAEHYDVTAGDDHGTAGRAGRVGSDRAAAGPADAGRHGHQRVRHPGDALGLGARRRPRPDPDPDPRRARRGRCHAPDGRAVARLLPQRDAPRPVQPQRRGPRRSDAARGGAPAMTSSLRVRLHNTRGRPQTLVLEPWGDVRPLEAGEALTLVVSGPSRALEIELTDEGITVYGSTGDVIDVEPGEPAV